MQSANPISQFAQNTRKHSGFCIFSDSGISRPANLFFCQPKRFKHTLVFAYFRQTRLNNTWAFADLRFLFKNTWVFAHIRQTRLENTLVFVYFRFFYDLKIRENFKNSTPNALIRFQNIHLKKSCFLSGSSRIPKVS